MLLPSSVGAERFCVYETDAGVLREISDRSLVPAEYRHKARCYDKANSGYLAKPDQIKLEGGSERKEIFGSPLGEIELRWTRDIENLFGRSPVRATRDAMQAVSRVLKSYGFPSRMQTLSLQWKIVFLDADLPQTQIPAYLRQGCHPGWMTPPANVYLVAQRVAGSCGAGKAAKSLGVADSMLARVLVHEIGHAVEYHLIKYKFGSSRMRAEGFATWFEILAARFSSLLSESQIKSIQVQNAKQSFRRSPGTFTFRGDAFDYARAAMYFHAVEKRFGLKTILNAYERLRTNNVDFFGALEKETGWTRETLEREARKAADA